MKGARPSPKALSQLADLFRAGRYAEMQQHASTLLKQSPHDAMLWKALGVAQMAMGQDIQALPALTRAAQLLPADAEAQGNVAQALAAAGRHREAEASFRKALQLQPRLANAWSGLGHLLGTQGRHAEAIEHLERAAALQPGSASIQTRLGNVRRSANQVKEACAAYERALALEPGSPEVMSNLGSALSHLGFPERAEALLRQAVALQPRRALYHSNLGNLLQDQGRLHEARAAYIAALALDPDFVAARSNLLLVLNNVPDTPPSEARAEAVRFGQWASARAAASLSSPLAAPGIAAPPPRLRVGFVSGDLRNHPVGYFLEGVLKHLDPARVELRAYSTVAIEDALTQRIKPHFSRWQSIAALDDASAARLIHADGVDILVDLAGHTAHNRLPLFAWRPAPVQVSWLGYFATTGVAEMDWLIADRVSVPPGHEAHFTERLWYLPGSRFCFDPPAQAPEVAPTPALARGHVTFGCFQSLGKVSDLVLSAWARVLRQAPGARLRLQSRQFGEAAMQALFRRRLVAAGIDEGRVSLHGPASRDDYLRDHAEVDILLDTFPYPGGTTTCEALWMGVPTITLAGDRMLSRQGASLMAAAGLEDWVAADVEGYVEMAVARAGDIGALARQRATLRGRLGATHLFDARQFASNFTQALQGMAGAAR